MSSNQPTQQLSTSVQASDPTTSLEQKLQHAHEILIIESLSSEPEAAELQRRKIERALCEIYERPFPVTLRYEQEVASDIFTNCQQALVIFNAQRDNGKFPTENLPFRLPEIRRYSEQLQAASPSADYLVLCPVGQVKAGSALRKALEIILAKFDREDDGFLGHLVGDYHNLLKRQTVLGYLEDNLGHIKHKIGAEKDAEFVKELSERFMEGNCQTRTEKTFLIVSNRLESLTGKFKVVRQDADFSGINFTPYAAVFVDNNYSFKNGSSRLGSGIQVLRKLSSLRVQLPFIYQTAHSLEDFTDEERQQLQAFPNVTLLPKNRAVKICSPQQAKKEVAVTELLQAEQLLSPYCVQAFPLGEEGYLAHENYALLATTAIQKVTDPQLLTSRFGLSDDAYAHRMAVLALFHARMKTEVGNPLFPATVAYLRPWDVVRQRLEEAGYSLPQPQEARELYCARQQAHQAERPTTIIHQDPKWDNWFKGYVLGDFSDCSPGTEFKDLARALLDQESGFQKVRDPSWVDARVGDYLTVRKAVDPEFEFSGNFAAFAIKVRELLFLESWRLAGFIAQAGTPHTGQANGNAQGNNSLVSGLLAVAGQYWQ